MRTLIYARVSTEDQLEKYGLPSQLRACRDFAHAQGWTVVLEVTDEGVSGTVLDRPGLTKVRSMVMEGLVDIVLMFDADRLSRELAHLLILKPEIERKARLEFVAAKFEDSPSGRMFFGIRGVIAQYEREQTRERTMRGRRERALSGRIVGGRVPFGYRYEKGCLLPDEETAPAVRDIFARYQRGASIRAITHQLRAAGVPTWGGKSWGHSSVRRILLNETYAGVAHYGTLRREGKLLRKREPSNRVAVNVPALVSREQWEAAQLRMSQNPQVGRPSTSYLLRGLLHCACGRKMSGEQGRKNYSYRCNGRDSLRIGIEACRTSLNVRTVDTSVWGSILEAFTDIANLRGLLAQYQEEVQYAAGGIERLNILAAQVARLKAREDRCLSLLLDADMASAKQELKAKYAAAQKERIWIEAEIAAALEVCARVQSAEEWLDSAVALLAGYLPTLESPADRQAFVRGLVTRAEWDSKEEVVLLHCSFGPQSSQSSGRCAISPQLQVILKARLAA